MLIKEDHNLGKSITLGKSQTENECLLCNLIYLKF